MRHLTSLSSAIALVFAIAGTATITSCGKTVTRTEPGAVRDLSGNWNATDVNKSAQKITADMLEAGWYKNFAEKNSRLPVVRMGKISLRLQDAEYVNTDILLNDLNRHMINSGKIETVVSKGQVDEIRDERTEGLNHADPTTVKADRQEVKADYLLTGMINSQDDSEGSNKQKFYSVDIFITNVATNKLVFQGNDRIAKDVSGASVR